jgi:hypothetical protein
LRRDYGFEIGLSIAPIALLRSSDNKTPRDLCLKCHGVGVGIKIAPGYSSRFSF